MSTPDQKRVRHIFDVAAELPASERSAFLDRMCEGDGAVRAQVESLLAALEGSPAFLASPTGVVEATMALEEPSGAPGGVVGVRTEGPGTTIGPYKLLQQIGEGGFGAVFMADQDKPVRRKVALKIIKLGMDTRQVVARFEQERQALAIMDHPNIAKVFDAGVTESGRPFFVMELCAGDPFTEYCDKNSLTIQERLDLFVQVCHAVQHAHHKGVIHRDIKPSNVLVSTQDGRAHAKIIDFGIAKATSSRLTEKTLFTEHKQLIGTPEYMSPEQAEGSLDIDTRTDVYSLGVLLYELLTGSTPFEGRSLRSAAYGEIQRIIREVDPPNPSTRLSQSAERIAGIAARRRAEPKKLGLIVRGELDWIVMKALEKDRYRRYDSANGLAFDVLRFIAGEPVIAAPPGRTYRVRKFVTRHRTGVIVAGAVAASLVLGVVGTSIGLVNANRERARAEASERRAVEEAQRAEREAERAESEAGLARRAEAVASHRAAELEQVVEFQASQLSGIDVPRMGIRLREMIGDRRRSALGDDASDPEASAERLRELESALVGVNFTDVALDTLNETIFCRAIDAIGSQFADQPLVQARLLHTLASTMRVLGLLERASEIQRSAVSLRAALLGEEHVDTLNSGSLLGDIYRERGMLPESDALLISTLDSRRRVLGPEHPETIVSMTRLALLRHAQGRLEESTTIAYEAAGAARRTLRDSDPRRLSALASKARIDLTSGRDAEGAALYQEVYDAHVRAFGKEHPSTLLIGSTLGRVYEQAGRLEEASALMRDVLDASRRGLGESHPDTLSARNSMGSVLLALGRVAEAEPEFREAMEGHLRTLGEDHLDTLTTMNNYAHLLQSLGRTPEAIPLLRRALEAQRRILGPDHPNTLISAVNLSILLRMQREFDEAEILVRDALERCRRVLGDEHAYTLNAVTNLGVILNSLGRHDEASAYYEQALAINSRVFGESHPRTLSSLNSMASLRRSQGRFDEAESLNAETIARARRTLPEGHPSTADYILQRAYTLRFMRRFQEAATGYQEGHAMLVASLGSAHPRTLQAIDHLSALYDMWHEAEPDEGHDQRAAQWRERRATAVR